MTTPVMNDTQVAAHLRDILSWVIIGHDLPRRIVRGTPMAANWTGTHQLHSQMTDEDGRTSHFTFWTERRNERVTATLRACFPAGTITWQEDIPGKVIRASIERVTG